jgi:1-deoxy-D-xylulose-5-phosphate reductoisomerase
MATRTVTILGSTGSVGESTLNLLEQVGADVEMLALTGGRNVARLAEQAKKWQPRLVVIEDESLLPELRARLNGSNVGAAAGRRDSRLLWRLPAPARPSRSPIRKA